MTPVSFYTPWKHQKNSSFLIFSEGTKENSGMKCIKIYTNILLASLESSFFIRKEKKMRETKTLQDG